VVLSPHAIPPWSFCLFWRGAQTEESVARYGKEDLELAQAVNVGRLVEGSSASPPISSQALMNGSRVSLPGIL